MNINCCVCNFSKNNTVNNHRSVVRPLSSNSKSKSDSSSSSDIGISMFDCNAPDTQGMQDVIKNQNTIFNNINIPRVIPMTPLDINTEQKREQKTESKVYRFDDGDINRSLSKSKSLENIGFRERKSK